MDGDAKDETTEVVNPTLPAEIRPVAVEAIKEKSDKQLEAGEQWQSEELSLLKSEIAQLKQQGASVADLQTKVETLQSNLDKFQQEQERRKLFRKSKRTPRRL